MKRLLKIGIAGCGAIGSSLARAIARDFSDAASLAALYDVDITKAKALSQKISKKKDLTVASLSQLINKSELVIEASSSAASWDIGKKTLSKGRDIMIMSVGGILKNFKQLRALAKKHASQVYIPSGALSGIDAVKAARVGGITKLILTTRKNPSALKEAPYIKRKKIPLERIKKDTLIYSGPAREAVKYFPQNINVAATLSLAGAGASKTIVRIIASPTLKRNVHEIRVESAAGAIYSRTENVPHPDNPKTSYLAVLSAIANLKQIVEPIKIGT